MALSTPARVRNRIQASDLDVSDAILSELIEDAQAFIEGKAGRSFSSSDSDYNLARSACTDLAAAYALISMLGGSYSGLTFQEAEVNLNSQQDTKTGLIRQYLSQVRASLDILKPQETSLRPKSSTS
jgi:hypothetical protein